MKFKTPHTKGGHIKSTIGIDIGSSSVKLARIDDINGQPTLMQAVLVNIDAGNEPNEQQAVITALKKGWGEIQAKKAKVICVFNAPEAYAGAVIIPPMPQEELPEAVKWEVKRYLSFPLEDAVFSFDVSGELVDKGVKKLNVAVAAVPSKSIELQLSLLTQAGINVTAILPTAFALQNVVNLWPHESHEHIAVMEMGASITELDIYRAGLLAFSRKLPGAGADLTRSMTRAITSSQGQAAFTLEEAERVKQQLGLSVEGNGPNEMIEGKISPAQMLSLMRPFLEHLTGETERSCDFYRETAHGGKVERIFVFGGGARLKGLIPFLSEELEVEVKEGNCLDGMACSPDVEEKALVSQNFNAAVGAALAATTDINLLPSKARGNAKRFLQGVLVKAAAGFAVIYSALFYISMTKQWESYKKARESINLEYRILIDQLQGLRGKILARQVAGNAPDWESVLREISHTIPSNIYLTHLSMNNEILHFKGIILPGQQATASALSQLMLGLEGGIFKNVRLITIGEKTGDSSVSEFEIKAEVE